MINTLEIIKYQLEISTCFLKMTKSFNLFYRQIIRINQKFVCLKKKAAYYLENSYYSIARMI